jgi:hypothetical protein
VGGNKKELYDKSGEIASFRDRKKEIFENLTSRKITNPSLNQILINNERFISADAFSR